MNNNNFYKKLILLYVEKDKTIREELSELLRRLFKTVIITTNVEDGYIKFKEITSNEQSVDLILSDIDMLERIREIDKKVPFIVTTEQKENKYLLKAMKLYVNHYAIKPISMKEMLLSIQKVCEKIYYKKIINKQRYELENYFNVISQVSTIYKMDENGKILYANKNFLEISKYTKEEIKELVLEDLLHDDIPDKLIKKAWGIIKRGKIWIGETKFKNKDKKDFYLKITIFKIQGETNEYVTMGFNQTEEYLKKRDFHKNVMLNIKDKNIKISDLNRLSQNQFYKIEQLSKYTIELQKKIEDEKSKTKGNLQQLSYYEQKLTTIEEKYEAILKKAEERNEEFMSIYNTMKQKYDANNKKVFQLEEEVELNEKTIENKNLKIKTLEENLRKRESQLKEVNPKLLYK